MAKGKSAKCQWFGCVLCGDVATVWVLGEYAESIPLCLVCFYEWPWVEAE